MQLVFLLICKYEVFFAYYIAVFIAVVTSFVCVRRLF